MGPDGEPEERSVAREGQEQAPRRDGGQSDRPHSHHAGTDAEPDPRAGLRPALAWLVRTDQTGVQFVRETVVSLLIVLAVGFLLFAVSGVWPPLVAVESDSMEPHLHKGDLVLVMEEHRLDPAFATGDTGIVTAETGVEEGYTQFGGPGDVIVYRPYGSESATPIIHRAHLWVEDGEDWYDRADPAYVQADSCAELTACPAPSDGFITKGDNPVTNDYYDQTRGISTVVEPEWVEGTAVLRIPWLGWIRLAASEFRLPGVPAALGAV